MSHCGVGSKTPTAEGNPGNAVDGATSEMSLELRECPRHWRSGSLSLEDSGRLSVFTLGSIFGESRKQRRKAEMPLSQVHKALALKSCLPPTG